MVLVFAEPLEVVSCPHPTYICSSMCADPSQDALVPIARFPHTERGLRDARVFCRARVTISKLLQAHPEDAPRFLEDLEFCNIAKNILEM